MVQTSAFGVAAVSAAWKSREMQRAAETAAAKNKTAPIVMTGAA
jgi:hypothetical protein